jgi:hypothetical protein
MGNIQNCDSYINIPSSQTINLIFLVTTDYKWQSNYIL